MKKLLTGTAIALSLLAAAAHAEPMIGKKLAVPAGGVPFCVEPEGLTEFIFAAMMKDKVQLEAILKEGKCTMLKKGIAIAVLEDLGDKNDELHGLKVRAMGNGVSQIGYTYSVGLVERN
jgi:hypothetical protein